MNLGYDVGHPYASCYHHDDIILVPYGDTIDARECPSPEKTIGSGNRTYTRNTIKREAEATARYPEI